MKRFLRRPVAAVLAALLITALIGLSACSGSPGGEDAEGSASGGSASQPEPAAGEAADSASLAEPGSPDGGTAPDSSRAGPARAPVRTEALVRTGTVSLRSDDVTAARFEVQKVVDRHAGTITEQETHTDGEGEAALARIVLRVPVAAFTTVISELEELGTLAESSVTTEDVTQQLIDLESRIAVQKASIDRVRALLAEATDLRDVVEIESQLTQRQADLDSMLQQQAYLADRSAMSTVTVHLERRSDAATREEADEEGFLAGFTAGWRSLKAFGLVLATVGGALLPWLVLLALVGLPAWVGVRRRRAPAPAPATGPAE